MIRVADVTGRARSAVTRASRAAMSRRTAPVWAVGGTVAVLLSTVAVLGGLEEGEVAPTPLAAGDEARASLYTVTVLDAELADEVEDESLSAEPGETLIILTMRLENLTDRPIGVGRSADKIESRLINVDDPLLSLSGVTSEEPTQVWRDDGSAGTVFLQPGVPSEVTMAWTAPDDVVADGIVELDVYDAVERHGQILLSADQISWQRGDLTARITVDVEQAE